MKLVAGQKSIIYVSLILLSLFLVFGMTGCQEVPDKEDDEEDAEEEVEEAEQEEVFAELLRMHETTLAVIEGAESTVEESVLDQIVSIEKEFEEEENDNGEENNNEENQNNEEDNNDEDEKETDSPDEIWDKVQDDTANLHEMWDDIAPDIAEEDIAQEEIDSFEELLDDLNSTVNGEEFLPTIENANQVTRDISTFMMPFSEEIYPEIFEARYHTRAIVLLSSQENFQKAQENFDSLDELTELIVEDLEEAAEEAQEDEDEENDEEENEEDEEDENNENEDEENNEDEGNEPGEDVAAQLEKSVKNLGTALENDELETVNIKANLVMENLMEAIVAAGEEAEDENGLDTSM